MAVAVLLSLVSRNVDVACFSSEKGVDADESIGAMIMAKNGGEAKEKYEQVHVDDARNQLRLSVILLRQVSL